MANADQCRRETERYDQEQRRRIREQEGLCRLFVAWDPRGWACWTGTAARWAALALEMAARRLLCATAEAVEEGERILSAIGNAIGGAIDHLAGTWFLGNDTGYWPIVRTTQRAVPSRPRRTAFARSIALAINDQTADMRNAYREEGAHVEVRLENGEVEWAVNGGAFAPLLPRREDYPPFAPADAVRDGKRAVSYDNRRLGEWLALPPFDLIAGGGDRLIAKVAGSDAIFILILDHPVLHRTGTGTRLRLPQTFFKLDPDCGRAEANRFELLQHVRVQDDDEKHPATERFPIFRLMFANAHSDTMDAWFPPRVWLKLDARPRKDTATPPRRYPVYDHVIYLSNLPDWTGNRERARRSVRYVRVLDLGIGSSHYHEQHDPRFGGETDSLSGRGGLAGRALEGLREDFFGASSFDAAFRVANGHVEDFGGWLDGTCIYFQMVQLKSDADIRGGDLRDAYAILWCDEQLAFTERWRVLHIYDHKFASPFQPIVGEVSVLEEEYYPGAVFDADRYFCPFQEGFIHALSRMAVARQFVAVTGAVPGGGADEIYTTHFAWGTMDKTWRRRMAPRAGSMTPAAGAMFASVDLGSLALRGDSTLMLEGAVSLNGKTVEGLWTQRVLPASCQETPSVADLAQEPRFSPRQTSYTHTWRFVEKSAAARLHQRFSHYGVLEPVDSRIQAFRLGTGNEDLESSTGLTTAEIESRLWTDTDRLLGSTHRRIDWTDAANIPDNPLSALRTGTYTGRFSPRLSFRLVRRPGLGWLMLHADKREDKMAEIALLNPRGNLTLQSDAPNPAAITFLGPAAVRRVRNLRDPHGVTVQAEPDGVSPPCVSRATVTTFIDRGQNVVRVRITLRFARSSLSLRSAALPTYESWLAMNVWRVKIACWNPLTQNTLTLADLEHMTVFAAGADETVREGEWTPAAADQRGGILASVLNEAGCMLDATSLWCVGSTGLAAPPDEVLWEVVNVL
jgi:hypothetical protein